MATPAKATGKQKAAAEKAGKKKTEAPERKQQELIVVNEKALSKTVGPAIVMGMLKTTEQEEKAVALMNDVKAKRYDLLAQTTNAIAVLYENDEKANPAAAFSADKKEKQGLNERILIALGIREYANVGTKEKPKNKLVYTKEVAKFFPRAGDPKDDPKTIAKSTLRSNVIHMIGKCAQAATAIHEKGIKTEMDEASGSLRISGPAVEKQFGAKEVVLNEKQEQTEKGVAFKLKEKPSFQALANMVASDHGAVTKKGSNDRTNKVVTDPNAATQSLCDTLIKAIGRITEAPEAKTRAALESLRSAIDKCLGD